MTLHALLIGGSAVLAALQALYMWLLKDRNRAGWALMGAVNVIGLPYDWFTLQYGYFALTLFNFLIAPLAWKKWGRTEGAS